MRLGEVERLRGELSEFVADVFGSLPRRDQRRWGECYLRGLMLDGRRKSIQPMADRLPDGNMQALQQFVNQSPWECTPVRRRIAERLCEAVRPEVWVVDDVSFPKCGTVSAGVARQYCGALGKRANCQVAVSVHAATGTASCPLEWELFLPEEWAHDDRRRRRAQVPDEVGHVSKMRLALGLLDKLAAQGLAVPVVVADAGYGRSVAFRLALEERGWSYVVAVDPKEIARPAAAEPFQPVYGGLGPPTLPRYREAARPLTSFVDAGTRFESVTWRQGSQGPDDLAFRGARSAALGQGSLPHRPGEGRWTQPVGRGAAPADAAGRAARERGRAGRLLDDEPARHHPGRRPGAVGEDALAHRARLPRAQARSGPGPLRGPHLARLAPPRHLRHRRPGIPHPPAARPKSRDAGLTLYQVLAALQDLLRCWTGTCTTCGRLLPNLRNRRRQPRT
ncbi:IS701 family transposase [Streptomyces hirsutus]|uniref:IS701 family transposase n=1 Tax=Streptomyces hirsutus TaxID=35620 RepID=UPI003D9E86BA